MANDRPTEPTPVVCEGCCFWAHDWPGSNMVCRAKEAYRQGPLGGYVGYERADEPHATCRFPTERTAALFAQLDAQDAADLALGRRVRAMEEGTALARVPTDSSLSAKEWVKIYVGESVPGRRLAYGDAPEEALAKTRRVEG